MFIDKKVLPQQIGQVSLVNLASIAFAIPKPITGLIPFKPLSIGKYHINRATFNVLLKKVFDNLENINSSHYLKDQWLYGAFKTLLLDTNSSLHNNMHERINNFYKYHPFNLDGILSMVMNAFFTKHTFTQILNDSKNGKIWTKIVTESSNGKEKLVIDVFATQFLDNLKITMNDKIPSKYKNFKDIVSEVLKSRIQIVLIKSDENFKWSNYQLLEKWINNFDYYHASLIQGQNIYDTFFNENALIQRINIIEQDFIENQLKKYFDDNLAANARKPMFQVVLHYLFSDLLISKKIKATSHTTLETVEWNWKKFMYAKTFFSKLYYLKYFLPGIGNILNQFGFYWKSDRGSDGLVIVPITTNKWLTSTNSSKTEFEFKFEFKFISNSVPSSSITKEYNIFKIIVNKTSHIFEQIKNFVKKFEDQVVIKNQYFLNASTWTEKDVFEWAPDLKKDFKTFKDKSINNVYKMKDFFSYSVLSDKIWSQISSYDLSKIRSYASSFDNSNYIFRILPNIHVYKRSILSINGNISGFLSLEITQNFKNLLVKLSPITLIKYYHFNRIKEGKILSMTEVIQELMRKKFPKGLNFDVWSSQKKSFWLNEFLDENDNVVRNLKTKEDLFKRSNFIAIKNYLQSIIEKINEYRNDFTLTNNYSIIKDSKSKNWIVRLKLTIKDSKWNEEITYMTEKKLKTMVSLKDISIGPFKGTNKLNSGFIYQLNLHGTPISPPKQKVPIVGSIVPKTFTFKIKGEKVTMHEILSTLQSYGFNKLQYSKVKSKYIYDPISKTNRQVLFTIISSEIIYHDFNIGNNVLQPIEFELNLNSYNFLIPPIQIQKDYDNIVGELTDSQKKDKYFLASIDNLFSILKISGLNNWRNDVKKLEYIEVINEVLNLIANFKESTDIILGLQEIYGDEIPEQILSKLAIPGYDEVFREILKQKDNFPNDRLKEILENNKFINFLKVQKINNIRKLVLNFLKITNKTKYAYLGSGVGLGMAGLLAGGTSLRWMRINAKAKKMPIKFKKNKYISIISLGSALISIGASVILTLMFFITKGGF